MRKWVLLNDNKSIPRVFMKINYFLKKGGDFYPAGMDSWRGRQDAHGENNHKKAGGGIGLYSGIRQYGPKWASGH